MVYRGHIRNGVAVPDDDVRLPEGAEVVIELTRTTPSSNALPLDGEGSTAQGSASHYAAIIGKADGLPADFARNHDHYIHGTAKR